jgi:5-methylcytosine-specific restriction endonuclease McrA
VVKQVGDPIGFPQFPVSTPVVIWLLAGFAVVLKVAAESWVTNRKREQRRSFYRDEYLKSDDWKRKRALVLKRDHYRYVYCGLQAKHVHHKRYAPRNIGKEPIEWLASVCDSCHRKQHNL